MASRNRSLTIPIYLLLLAPSLALAQDAATAIGPGAAAPAAATDTVSPVQVVESLHDAILQSMKRAGDLDFQARFDLLGPVVSKSFDLDFMGTKSVGRHWKTLSDEEKKTWLAKFTRLTTANYAGRFKRYGGERFETLGEEPAARATRLVLTRLVIPGEEDVQLNYRLRQTEDGWRIIDVYLNGTISELALRRSDFASTLKRGGFAKLAAAIDQKIDDLQHNDGG